MSQFIDILRQHLADFRRRYAHQITPEMQDAIHAMLSCRCNTARVSCWGLWLTARQRQKLRQQIQLMLAVTGAVFPMLPEVKRALAVRYCPCCHLSMHFMGVHMRYRPTGGNITA